MAKVANPNRNYTRLIIFVSVLIPIAVAVLLMLPAKLDVFGDWVKSLPYVNAAINTTTALLLMLAVVMIKRKNIAVHRYLMTTAFILGSLFLVSYILYHSSVPSTVFGDTDGDGLVSMAEMASISSLRPVYLVLLLSHILLSIVVVPLVLLAFYYSLTDQIEKHKKIVKLTFPIWLYVSISGVIVFLMISPYYQ